MSFSFYFVFPFKHCGVLVASGVAWISHSHEKDNVEQPKETYRRSHNKSIEDGSSQSEGDWKHFQRLSVVYMPSAIGYPFSFPMAIATSWDSSPWQGCCWGILWTPSHSHSHPFAKTVPSDPQLSLRWYPFGIQILFPGWQHWLSNSNFCTPT